ncbi:MAG: DUF4865 family protein [Alphaproteobacteria bacterium]
MLAMQMSIRLGMDRDDAAVHAHLGECARRFIERQQIIHASCLLDDAARICAPFYVWRSPGDLRGFLLGNSFTDVVESCGRPRVRTWNVLEFDRAEPEISPTFAVREVDALRVEECLGFVARREAEAHRAALQAPGLHARVVMIDPDRWEIARLSLWRDEECAVASDADCVQSYRVTGFSQAVAGCA